MCVVSERPSLVRAEAADPARGTVRLHCADGPAMLFRDGWPVHAWHGRRVPAWVVESPDAERIAAEPNVEIRRCAIESLGWSRFIRDARLERVGVPEADPGNPGQYLTLYDIPERVWGDRARLLVMTNGSTERDGTRRQYAETVDGACETPVEAAGWRVGLTAAQYAQTVRRT